MYVGAVLGLCYGCVGAVLGCNGGMVPHAFLRNTDT